MKTHIKNRASQEFSFEWNLNDVSNINSNTKFVCNITTNLAKLRWQMWIKLRGKRSGQYIDKQNKMQRTNQLISNKMNNSEQNLVWSQNSQYSTINRSQYTIQSQQQSINSTKNSEGGMDNQIVPLLTAIKETMKEIKTEIKTGFQKQMSRFDKLQNQFDQLINQITKPKSIEVKKTPIQAYKTQIMKETNLNFWQNQKIYPKQKQVIISLKKTEDRQNKNYQNKMDLYNLSHFQQSNPLFLSPPQSKPKYQPPSSSKNLNAQIQDEKLQQNSRMFVQQLFLAQRHRFNVQVFYQNFNNQLMTLSFLTQSQILKVFQGTLKILNSQQLRLNQSQIVDIKNFIVQTGYQQFIPSNYHLSPKSNFSVIKKPSYDKIARQFRGLKDGIIYASLKNYIEQKKQFAQIQKIFQKSHIKRYLYKVCTGLFCHRLDFLNLRDDWNANNLFKIIICACLIKSQLFTQIKFQVLIGGSCSKDNIQRIYKTAHQMLRLYDNHIQTRTTEKQISSNRKIKQSAKSATSIKIK